MLLVSLLEWCMFVCEYVRMRVFAFVCVCVDLFRKWL